MFPNNRMGKNNENLIKQITYISKDGDTLSLINYKYWDTNSENQLTFLLTDELNQNETIITYHFQNNWDATFYIF